MKHLPFSSQFFSIFLKTVKPVIFFRFYGGFYYQEHDNLNGKAQPSLSITPCITREEYFSCVHDGLIIEAKKTIYENRIGFDGFPIEYRTCQLTFKGLWLLYTTKGL